LVGDYQPTQFGFRTDEYWVNRKMTTDEIQNGSAAK
jgi:hypothetical protein